MKEPTNATELNFFLEKESLECMNSDINVKAN